MKRFLFLLAAIATVVALAPKASYAHRYFDTWAARGTTPDPALNENPQVLMKKYGYTLFETSPYMYTHDNPLRYADPNGKRGFDMIGGPMLPPTSWAQLKRNVIMAAAETGGAALLYYAPQAAATIASWWLQNPVAGNEAGNAVLDALSPAPTGASELKIGDVTIKSVDDLAKAAGTLDRLSGGVKQGTLDASVDKVFESLADEYGAKIEVKSNGARIFKSGDLTVTQYISSTDKSPSLMVNQAGKIIKYRGQ